MKRVIQAFAMAAVLAVTHLLAASSAQATEVGNRRNFGLGFAIGSPSSLVGKLFLGGDNALDFGVSFLRRGRWCRNGPGPDDCNRFSTIGVFGDYLWHDTLARGTAQLDWHIGAGGRMWIGNNGYYDEDDELWLGARMPIGIDLTFDRPNFLEVFLDIVPTLYVVPGPEFDVEAYVGVRLYF